MNILIRAVIVIIGSVALYYSSKLIVLGKFTFKGDFYSIEHTPVTFFLHLGLLFLFGAYLVGYALFFCNNMNSHKKNKQ
ncbi:hypothetical protein [Rheinheimera sp. WS51]|uniref:hypothetical protein n=1 Tax=Rheinheimera sp. WS51 TaxID=3425886 RepID=UPI003D8EEB00